MGHWSTYRRRGGGPPTAPALIFIEVAEVDPPFEIHVEYSGEVDANDFDTTAFHTQPTNYEPESIDQGGVSGINLTFQDDVEEEASLTYAGDTPGILTPQTVDLS
jgi:hypothetical protein